MLNQVLEATLAVMILLLAMSVAAIARVDPAPPDSTEATADGEHGPHAAGAGGVPAAPPWPRPLGQSYLASPPLAPPRRTGWLGRTRYEARHVKGRMPKPRLPGPTGPPWGPAAPPPGFNQPGSERWI